MMQDMHDAGGSNNSFKMPDLPLCGVHNAACMCRHAAGDLHLLQDAAVAVEGAMMVAFPRHFLARIILFCTNSSNPVCTRQQR
jgi:hypothetical protein